ncbi:hypothetical protein J0A67_15005 [Algoriphagus aestuariicola]|uniref:Right-handed parallel beta-helix repeat-containing protein n=1 Tax=Algoriphagus aestuariicola TaxID=1852016 RepID=A0ABS3BSA0_9BACT|nr:hypothetical protein [Algoriphagus aestuariicola]MBN7802180.1 hypothetical protein [Algoriphagus aestuariicola]
MKKPKIILVQFAILLGIVIGCDTTEKPLPNNPIEVNGVPDVLEVQVYESIGPLTIGVFGKDFLSSFRILKNGEEFEVWNLNQAKLKYFYSTFTYAPSPLEIGEDVLFEFEARDMNGDMAKSEMKLTVSDLPNTIRVSSDISTDQTWESGKTYILSEQVSVLPSATLTIQKGVIVKVDAEKEGEAIPFLVIERGAKIMANGTQEEPIIFTSIFDKIQPGQIKSSFLPQAPDLYTNNAKGGIVILGNAKGSFASNFTEVSLKGEDGAEYGLIYGGNDGQDNSGVLNYVSIRNVGPLTLAAVGSGTQVDKVEVFQGGQIGIRVLGGAVNLENIMVSDTGTGLSIDQGWNGTLENFYLGNCISSIIVGGPKGNYYGGNHHINKGSIFVSGGGGILNFEENSNTDLSEIYFEFTPSLDSGDYPVGADSWEPAVVNYWINLVPKKYMPKVSELEVYSYDPFTSSEFLEWSERVTIMSNIGINSVGVDPEPFKKWSIIHENL